jgi:cell division protein FtsZ
VLVIVNDKLREIYGNLPIGQAFAQADNVLTTAAKGISEIITLTGYVNVDFQDVRTVMHNAGPAVMGTAETRGEGRARKAASGALTSPLLDNCDIMGAKKILLSIVSGVEAELQMDELMEITEYIQEQAGQDAEVIFGHGVDSNLGDRLRVTVIATGFDREGDPNDKPILKTNEQEEPVAEKKKIHDLDRSQIWMFESDTLLSKPKEIEIKKSEESVKEDREEERPLERELVFTGPFNKIDSPNNHFDDDHDDHDDLDGGLFGNHDDEFERESEKYGDQIINDDGMMELRTVKDRLLEQAQMRKEKLKNTRKQEMTKEEFNEKWALPAYLRRGVKMDNVPHSSEQQMSKYNLNEDNGLLGNNKFLHDNVD